MGQVRLDLRAGVQPRRDGEPGPRHLQRAVHPPRRGHARRPGPTGRGDPARDVTHVVRRPGDPAVVGRHLAEGVVRRPHGLPRQRGGHRVRQRLDHLRRPAQGVGLSPGPAAHHPSHRGHRRRCGGGPAELRRHHLRQGCIRAQAADGLRRTGGVPRRQPRVLRPVRLRQHRAGRPARLPGARVRARPADLVEGLAPDRRHLAAHPGGDDRPGWSDHAAGGDPQRDRPGHRRTADPPAPSGGRPLRTGGRRPAAGPVDRDGPARGADRDPGSRRRAGSARAGQRRRPQLRQGAPRPRARSPRSGRTCARSRRR